MWTIPAELYGMADVKVRCEDLEVGENVVTVRHPISDGGAN